MFAKRNVLIRLAVCFLFIFILSLPVSAGASSEEPLYQRRNFFGMHNLKDAGPSIASGMEAGRQLVRDGFVFDWVFDFEPWKFPAGLVLILHRYQAGWQTMWRLNPCIDLKFEMRNR